MSSTSWSLPALSPRWSFCWCLSYFSQYRKHSHFLVTVPRKQLTPSSPTHPFLFTVNKSSRAPPLVGSFTSCGRMFSSTHFGNLLESFLSVVLCFQQTSGSVQSIFIFILSCRPNLYCITDSCMIFFPFLNFLRWCIISNSDVSNFYWFVVFYFFSPSHLMQNIMLH